MTNSPIAIVPSFERNITPFAERQTAQVLKIVEGELCVSYKGLELAGISKMYAWKAASVGSWRHYENSWIAYESIGKNTRFRLDIHYGDIWLAWAEQEYLARARMCIDPDDADYFTSLKQYEQYQVNELKEACGWLRFLSSIYTSMEDVFFGRGTISLYRKAIVMERLGLPDSFRHKGGVKEVFLTQVVNVLATQNLYGLRVKNYRVLDAKVKDWLREGRVCLVSSYFGNVNQQKLPEWATIRIFDLYAGGIIKTEYAKITRILNSEMREREVLTAAGKLVEISEVRVRQLIRAEELRLMPSRGGKVLSRQKTQTTIRGAGYRGSNQLWSVDGTTIQLFIQRDGKMVKLGYFVIVVDAYSSAILGWAIGKTETSQLVQKALRDALRKSGGKMGKWFNSDHGSANMSSEVKAMLGQLEAIGLMSQAYNPQSKPVEAVIGKFEQSILRYYPNFAGGNRTAKKQDSFENSDVLKQMLKDGTLPTEEEGIFQFAQAIEVYNNEVVKGKSRMSRYRDGENLGLTVSELVLVDLLWVLRKDKGKYTKDGLIIEVEGERHIFEVESERGVEDAAFKRAYFNAPFEIRYNPEDLSAIHLYQDTVWVAKANAKYAFGKTPDQHEGKERELWQKRMTARVDEEKEALRFVADNRKAMADMNLQPVDFQMVFKDALNEIEEHLSMADYNRPQAAVSTIIKQHKAKVGLYDDDASFAIIE